MVFGFNSLASAQTANAIAAQGQGQQQSQTVIPVVAPTFNNTANANAQQGQTQTQGQGQGQSLIGNSGSPTSASSQQLSIGGSTSISVNPRQFPVPGGENFATLPSYFGPATADVNWQTMKTMTKFKMDWSSSDAEALLEGGKLKSKPKCLYGTMSDHPVGGILRVAVNGEGEKMVQDQGLTLVGTDDVWAKNVTTTTREVLGQAIYDGLCMNADVLLVTGEGAAVVLKAFGWGAGLNNSVSVVSGGLGQVGNVTAAGIGVSSVEAGYHSKPWLQVLYFKNLAAAAPAPPPPPEAVAPPPPPPVEAPVEGKKLKERIRGEEPKSE
jgi:hypothetical protein